MFSLIYFCGLREGEVIRIRLSDIRPSPGGLSITVQGLKNGLMMSYELPPIFQKKLKRWLRVRPAHDPENDYFFPAERGLRVGHAAVDVVKRGFATVAGAAGLAGRSVHSLRHTCAMMLIKDGANAVRVQKWLRHRALSSSQAYFATEEHEQFQPEAARILSKAIR